MTEGWGPSATGPAALPAGVRARYSWRPPMLHAMDALLLGIETRTRPFRRGVDGLVAWHAVLARRAEPWSGWHPLVLPHGAAGAGPEPPQAGPFDGPIQGEAATPSAAPGRARQSSGGPSSPSDVASVRPSQSSARVGRPAEARIPRGRPLLSRPGIRLASLRPRSGAVGSTAGDPTRAALIERPPAVDQAPPWRESATAEPPHLRFGPILSASPSPRQEVRGGFPARSAIAGVAPTPGARFDTPPPVAAALRVPSQSAAESQVRREPTGAPVLAPGHPAGLPPDGPSLVERLIQSTVLPAPLPGLALRLVPPEERAAGEAVAPAPARGERADDAAGPGRERAPGAAQPPPLDLDAIAERVYQTLQRRQQLERERRGLY